MSHKFKIGQAVRHRNQTYRVIARLPEANNREPRYRIRHEMDDDEQIVVQKDLAEASSR
jgi:heat shock protein HspQ